MKVFLSISDLKAFVVDCKKANKSIGFVPTMGALHKGHISLIEAAKAQNDYVIASVFVNPTQFNNAADLENYPRNVDDDLAQLESAGCDVVFNPSNEEMYPDGQLSETFDFGGLDTILEGKYRPGHFQGMATIVKRFLKIVLADHAYFGEKDYQQLLLIQKLIEIENIPTQIIGCPTMRELDGLAMSSRNFRLNAEERMAAPAIFEALNQIKERAGQHKSLNRSISKAIERINAHPELATEYLEIVDGETLKPIFDWNETNHARVFAAVYAGEVRLIDNIKIF